MRFIVDATCRALLVQCTTMPSPPYPPIRPFCCPADKEQHCDLGFGRGTGGGSPERRSDCTLLRFQTHYPYPRCTLPRAPSEALCGLRILGWRWVVAEGRRRCVYGVSTMMIAVLCGTPPPRPLSQSHAFEPTNCARLLYV